MPGALFSPAFHYWYFGVTLLIRGQHYFIHTPRRERAREALEIFIYYLFSGAATLDFLSSLADAIRRHFFASCINIRQKPDDDYFTPLFAATPAHDATIFALRRRLIFAIDCASRHCHLLRRRWLSMMIRHHWLLPLRRRRCRHSQPRWYFRARELMLIGATMFDSWRALLF